MAYGRLDVFWPDGKIENFPLAEDKVSIGRSSGNMIVLDTDTISRYHFAFTVEDDQVYMTDLESVNGTYVDGVRLNPGEPVQMNGGEEIQIGYMRMLYFALDDDPTMQMSSVLEDTQRAESETSLFRLELQPPPISIAPGSYTSAEVTIFNTGKTTQMYAAQVAGFPDGWARVNRPLVELDPGDSTTIVVNIKPSRRSDSAPGIYNARMMVRLQDRPDSQLEIPFKVTILPFGGFGMALASKRFGSGDLFQLHVHNQGSAPLPLQITGRDPAQQMHFVIRPSQLTLSPGQRMQIGCQVKPAQRRLFGMTQEYPFDLVVQSLDTAHFTAAVRGQVVDKPPLPFWASFLMIGGLLLAVVLVVFGIGSLLGRTPDPVIDRFTVDNGTTQIAQGDKLRLSWDVRNATFITIRLNDQAVLTSQLAALLTSTELDTSEISGDVLVTLIASNQNDSRIASFSQTVTVYVPPVITEFAITPQPVIRHVVQNLTITYDVPGAVNINFTGLEQLAQSPLIVPPGDSGSLALTILPEVDFAVTLNATTESGIPAQQTLNIALIDPICQPINASASIYTLPSTTTNVLSTVPQGFDLVVNGRDSTAQWLRTIVPQTNIEGWANRNDFTCAPNFQIENLRSIIVDVVLPTSPVATTTIAPPLTVIPVVSRTPTQSIQVIPSPTVNTSGN
ncbi:MAG: FHA domain-containing protein [Anaerolineae bacterium]|nr:FHA domain-containing protein [Anaerolineae bacterium]